MSVYLRIVMAILLWTGPYGLASAQDDDPVGLLLNTDAAYPGYNLFAPLDTGSIYLIDNEGRVINFWEGELRSGSVYLLENGNLLRLATYGLAGNGTFRGGGSAYKLEEYNWDGEKVWEYVHSSDQYLVHHDIEPLPNGNILILSWEMKTKDECIQAGRDPEILPEDELWSEYVIEVERVYPDSVNVVWEWHLWDHLIQDFDPDADNFGDVAAHPERVDINPTGHWMDRISDEEREQLEALGYLGGDESDEPKRRRKRRGRTGADWLHTNGMDYNAELDQIALSVLGNNEIWIIDHSTTTEEARGSSGGRAGMGGDILYRYGNPIAYRRGDENDQVLFAQHDIRWIPKGYPGEGNLMVFNNGRGRPDGLYSSVDEFVPPLTDDGTYRIESGKPFGPQELHWTYSAPNPKDFYSFFISGAERLPNGNTLICSGAHGRFFEVTPDKEIVWHYVNPAIPIFTEEREKERRESGRRRFNANITFRVSRYGPDYPAFEGKDLTPGPLLTEFLETRPAVVPLEREDSE